MSRGPGEDLRNPNYSGSIGRAWEITLYPEALTQEQESATLGAWLIEAPFVAPFWSYHGATLIHLRDIPGEAPATIVRPDATHQFDLIALDPNFNDFYDPDDIDSLQRPITGTGVSEQIIFPEDAIVLAVARTAIQKCVDGELLPDSDYKKAWHDFFQKAELPA